MKYNFLTPYFAILIIGVGLGIFRYSKLSEATRTILYMTIITLLTELLAHWLGLNRIPNLVVYNSFMVIQTVLLGIAFVQETSYRPIIVMASLTVLLVIVFWFLSQDKFNSNGLVSVLTFMVTISLIYFYLLIRHDTIVPLRNFPFFWFSTGFLTFGVLNVLGFGLIYIFKIENQFLNELFTNIRIYSNYFLYLLFILAFALPQNSLKNT